MTISHPILNRRFEKKSSSAKLYFHRSRGSVRSTFCLLTLALYFLSPDPRAHADERLSTGYARKFILEVMRDRPRMAEKWKSDTSFQCSILSLVSVTAGRVEWDDADPTSGRNAEYEINHHDNERIKIRILDSDALKGGDLWVLLVFEIMNSRQIEKIRNLYDAAVSGTMSQEDFVDNCVWYELQATILTLEFFETYEATTNTVFESDVYDSMKGCDGLTLREYYAGLDRLPKNSYDPRDYFCKAYNLMQRSSLPSGTQRASLFYRLREAYIRNNLDGLHGSDGEVSEETDR